MELVINGHTVLVDEADLELLSRYRWYYNITKGKKTGYILGFIKGRSDKSGVGMHRVILNAQKGEIVDHVNRNGLDNRRENLRIVNAQQSIANRGMYKTNKSGFTGVIPSATPNKWVAQIGYNREVLNLGTFTQKEDAARAYDAAAKMFFGEFARLNFPE